MTPSSTTGNDVADKLASEAKSAAIRDGLIAAGVRNLKEFGYPSVTPDNILTDMVFSRFFRSMLEDNLGLGADDEINALLAEIPA